MLVQAVSVGHEYFFLSMHSTVISFDNRLDSGAGRPLWEQFYRCVFMHGVQTCSTELLSVNIIRYTRDAGMVDRCHL